MNKSTSPTAIRLTRTPEVARALALAKKVYPTLSDSEILKVGLATLTTKVSEKGTAEGVRRTAAYSMDMDGYIDDAEEDVYQLGMGKKVNY